MRTTLGAPGRSGRKIDLWLFGLAAAALLLAGLQASATGNSFEGGVTARYVDVPGTADASVSLTPGVLRAASSLASPALPSVSDLVTDQSRTARADAIGTITLRDQLQAGHRYRVRVRLNVPTVGPDAPSVHASNGPLSLGVDPDRRDSWAVVHVKAVFRAASDGASIRRDLSCTGHVAGYGPCQNPGTIEFQQDISIRPQDQAFIEVSVELTAFATMTPFGSSAAASGVAHLIDVTAEPID